MTTTIKITELTNIGANLASSTVIPVVNMAGTPTTEKTVLGNIANVVLAGAGGNYVAAAKATTATTANTVLTNAQPNITSVGTLTNVAVSGNASVNGNITANGTAYLGNISTTGIASITTLSVGTTANLGAVANVTITGGTAGQVLTTNGSGNLSWTTVSGGSNGTPGGSNTQIQFNDANSFGGNTGFTFNKTTGIFTSPFVAGNGNGLSNIQGANISGFVPNANVANTAFAVAAANVSGLGNIATINLDGNVSNVLLGNGVFGGIPTSTPASISNGNSNVNIANGNGNVTITSNGTRNWTFDTTGNLTTAGDLIGLANANFTIYSNAAAHEFIFGDDGTFYAPDNVVLGGNSIYIGPGANTLSGIQHEVFIASSNLFPYVQAVINNISDNGSADWVALGAKGGDTGGTTSLGFTSSGFGDANYTITGNGDGYVLVQSYAPGQTLLGGGGNLVLATGSQGSTKDIIFGTGGFLTANTFGRISHANNSLELTRTGASLKFPDGTTQTTAYTGGGNGTPGGSNTQIQFNDSGNFGANSGFTFDSITGNISIPGTIISGNTITIDNRASGNGADINLYSADDILIQARDRDAGSTSEGGDINIFAGDSAEDSDTSAGDIVIEAGRGGASNLDFGGDGGFVRVEAGQGGAAVGANISARSGGSLTLNAGNAGGNNGNIDLGGSGGDVTINAGDSTGNGDPGGSIILRSGDAGANALAGQIQLIIPGGDVGAGGTWTFDGEGIIQLPNSGTIGNDGNNIDIGSTGAISLEASTVVNIFTDTGTNAWQWQFQDDGNLRLPTIELDIGNTINEQTVIQSQRKIIPGLRYSAEITGTTPTVVYTATSVDTTSMKVTMQIQHTGLGFEFFDVSATSTGGDTFYTVSNRVQPPTIDNSTVVVDLNGSNIMEITVTINSGAANSWVTYDATEFGIAVD
jgi:hypothetical protein